VAHPSDPGKSAVKRLWCGGASASEVVPGFRNGVNTPKTAVFWGKPIFLKISKKQSQT